MSIKGIEGLRILCETTFDDMPDATIEAWCRAAVEQFDNARKDTYKEALRRIEEGASVDSRGRVNISVIRDILKYAIDTNGVKTGEVVVVGGGSGLGKSLFLSKALIENNAELVAPPEGFRLTQYDPLYPEYPKKRGRSKGERKRDPRWKR